MTLRIDPALSSVKLASLQKGIVLNMSLDQESYNPATKRFTDKTPYSNHGTSYNDAIFTTDRMGQPNRAMSFNGTDDYVDCGNDESLNLTDAITIEAWVKHIATGSYEGIAGKGGWNNNWWIATHNSGAVLFYLFGVDNWVITGETELYNGNWHHVVFTYDKDGGTNNMCYYRDNTKRCQTKTGSINSGPSASVIIGSITPAYYPFKGAIDEVRIYNRALSADEITSLYEMYRPKFLI